MLLFSQGNIFFPDPACYMPLVQDITKKERGGGAAHDDSGDEEDAPPPHHVCVCVCVCVCHITYSVVLHVIPPPSPLPLSLLPQQFLLTPRTHAQFRKIDEEFDHMLRQNQLQAMPVRHLIRLIPLSAPSPMYKASQSGSFSPRTKPHSQALSHKALQPGSFSSMYVQ